MRDKITNDRVSLMHPKVRQDFINFINDAETALNVILRAVQVNRTFEEQQAIYNQGRTTPGPIVTHSKPGSSYHNYDLAVDLAQLMPDGKINWDFDYHKLIPFATKYGLKWGGNWGDEPHFEKNLGYNWRVLLDKYNKKEFITGTKYLIL